MTLLTDTIFEELAYSPSNDNINFNISAVGFIPQDVDESLKVFIREDAREFLPSTVNFTTDYINLADHAYSNTLQVKALFTTNGLPPSPLVNGTEYFVQYVDRNNITLSLTSGGAPIDLTSQGTGTHKLEPLDPNGIELLLANDFTITKDTNGQPIKITLIDRVMQSTQNLFIVRESNTLQEDVDYAFGTPWQPVEYETHIDKIYAILQEQGNKISRAMLTRIGDSTSANLTFPVPQDNSAVGWYQLGSTYRFRNYDLSIYATKDELTALSNLIGSPVDLDGKVLIPNPFNDISVTGNFNTVTVLGTDFTVGTDSINFVGHGFVTDDPVLYTTLGDAPDPLVSGVIYYVLYVDDDNFQLQATQGSGVAITITDQGASPTDEHVFTGQETTTFTATGHGLLNEEKVTFIATTPPTGLTSDTSYYVGLVDANTFSLSATVGGAAILISDAGSLDQVVRSFNTTGLTSTGIAIDGAVATSVSIEFEGYRDMDGVPERYMGNLKYIFTGTNWEKVSEKFDILTGTPTILFEHAVGSILSINVKALGLSGVTYDDTSYFKYIAHTLKV